MECPNAKYNCWNCPALNLKGYVDFRACGQTSKLVNEGYVMAECHRRPDLGVFEPEISFEQCSEWKLNKDYNMYMLKDMRVMILGIDGYLGWTLALKLGKLGFKVSGIDNFWRRDCVKEKESHSIIPIEDMRNRIRIAKEVLGIDIDFKKIDITDTDKLKNYLKTIKPEAIIHYAECPSAPYSMVDMKHAIKVQENNVLGTLGLLWLIKETVPESCLIKLGTMGEYGTPLTGRPLFEGIFPADAILKWNNEEWSLGGELTPRDPCSFYHVSKVQDTFNVYESCKYWRLRSYDVMQGIIYGTHTDEVSADPRLRTRLDNDEWFGTVINRFVTQAIINNPLTVYGTGEQLRGAIALNDAMDCMVRLICCPPVPGQYSVVNQVSGLYSINEIANTVKTVGKDFNYDVKINHFENPRVESDKHPLNVVATELSKRGFTPMTNLKKGISEMFRCLTDKQIIPRIKQTKDSIVPKTRWNGESKEVKIINIDDKKQEYTPIMHGIKWK